MHKNLVKIGRVVPEIAGYNVFRRDHGWRKGGVAVYVNSAQQAIVYGDRQLTTTPSSYCGFVSVIHSDMVYDPEYTTGLYQREAQTLWIVTSSSECYI